MTPNDRQDFLALIGLAGKILVLGEALLFGMPISSKASCLLVINSGYRTPEF
jgi:hypothetical protein